MEAASPPVRVLLIGDISGRSGRRAVREHLPGLRSRYELDLVVANGENASGGLGLTPETARELFGLGIDLITSGNHIWRKREIFDTLNQERRLLRPANYPPGVPGRGSIIVPTRSGHRFGVMNLIGRVFMDPVDCPFRTADVILKEDPLGPHLAGWLVDFHAEATSEKAALAQYLDGRVSAVIGTHTHIPTSDERILAKGTGVLSDVGMTGSYDSTIGMTRESTLPGFLTALPCRFLPDEREGMLCAVLVEVDPATGKAVRVAPIRRGVGLRPLDAE